MKFEDETQNLKLRMTIIHGLVFVILVVLGARLYYLQVVNGEYYAERAENQRVRHLRIPAPRGAIFDRNGKLLVDSRSTYNIILSAEDMKGKNLSDLVAPLSDGLGVDPDILRERFEQAKSQPAFEEITVKEGAGPADLAWVDAHTLEMPMLLVREQPQRRYPDGGVLAHVLGYVGEISPEQLKQPKFKDYAENPYHPGDTVGQEGLEATYDRYLLDPLFPLYNRAIRGRYPPGSTWKPLMATAGLQQGAITLKNSHLVCGGGITIGNKFTRCMGSHGAPDLRTAIRVSCDAYFYRLGLKMTLDGIEQMVDEFDLNKRTGVDLPHELVSWTPSREFKARFNPRAPEWKDIDTVYASFGQVYDFVTPLASLRAHSAVANGGRLYVPHLLLEARPVGEIGPFPERPRQVFPQSEPKIINIPEDQHHLVVDGMWAVVNEAGTGTAARIPGFDVAGKTGTAQVVGLGKDTG